MSVTATAPAAPADPPAEEESTGEKRRSRRTDLLVAAVALGVAVYVVQVLWTNPYQHVLQQNTGDQSFFEWLLGYGVQVLHGHNPFFSDLMNAPNGVNLAVNTSVTATAVLFAPITYLFGPPVSYATILTLNLAGTAFAWYLFYTRFVVRHRAAAAVAGLFCGFAPGMISHANGHLNWTSGWIAPLAVWWVFKLREPGRLRWLRNGAILGLIVAAGFTIAAEGLFFTALATAIFLLVWSMSRATWPQTLAAAPSVLKATVVTAVVAGGLLAYPLWMHFAGPGSFAGTGFDQSYYAEDLGSYLSYANRSMGAWAGMNGGQLASNSTEETTFFGLPLMLLVVVSLVVLYRYADAGRRATLRALIAVGVVFIALSAGPQVKLYGEQTGLKGPYNVLMHWPLFDSALPARYGLVVVGVIGLVLAFALDQLLTAAPAIPRGVYLASVTAFVVALAPVFPTPLLGAERSREPAFIADGTWKQYVPDNGVLSALPFGVTGTSDAIRWSAYTMARGGKQFRIPAGYFLGQSPEGEDAPGQIGAPWRRTDYLLWNAAHTGNTGGIQDFDREEARRDFAYWGVNAVFLPVDGTLADGVAYRDALLTVATDLLGQPEQVSDVLLWRIRPGIDPD